jgi:hypothetical protein
LMDSGSSGRQFRQAVQAGSSGRWQNYKVSKY